MRIFYALALVATLAHADGATLLTPAKAPAADQARNTMLSKEPGFVSLTPVNINRHALDSNAINVQIEGKVYRFTRVRVPGVPDSSDSWFGNLGQLDPANYLSLTRDKDAVIGVVVVNAQQYRLIPGALIKSKAVALNPDATPEWHAARAAEAAAREAKAKAGKL